MYIKKTLTGLLLSSLFVAGSAFAEQDTPYSIFTAHPSGYIDSPSNIIYLQKWDYNEKKWKTVNELENFNSIFFTTVYKTDNKPINGYDRIKDNTHYNKNVSVSQNDRNLFVSKSYNDLIKTLITEKEECYASNFAGGNLNNNDNFWTCITPNKLKIQELDLKSFKRLSSTITRDDKNTFFYIYKLPGVKNKVMKDYIERDEALKLLTPPYIYDHFNISTKEIERANTPQFSDIQSSEYANLINIAKEKNMIKGYSDGKFRPNELITWAEASKLVVNLRMKKNIQDSTTGEWYDSYLKVLKDEKDIEIKNPQSNPTIGELIDIIWTE